jgi:hypothetical protein
MRAGVPAARATHDPRTDFPGIEIRSASLRGIRAHASSEAKPLPDLIGKIQPNKTLTSPEWTARRQRPLFGVAEMAAAAGDRQAACD